MKLSEHVDKLRTLIEAAFDKQFARLGLGPSQKMDLEKLPEEIRPKRQRFEEMLTNHEAETGSYANGRAKLVDELTFTLFNRIAALKVMEKANLFPPIITKEAEHGDRSFGHKAWLEINSHMRGEELEGIRDYLKSAFDELGNTLPLYSKEYPYALLPDAISLNEIIETFNEVEQDSQVEDDIWQSDDILGWLYESYNNARKLAFKDSKAKTEYDKVSLQSQVYTPRWVVEFLVQNSLGKLYLEMYPDSEIKTRFKIANAPKTQEREPKPLAEVRMIDPACGSGNFLLYGFDFFYELYLDQIENYGADYEESEIPGLIIEKNLHGIDLDDRAVQLAQLGLFIKARKRQRTVGELSFKVVSSDFFLPDYEDVRHIFEEGANLNQNQQELIADIWADLRHAYKFGSLIRLDEKIKAKLNTLKIEQTGTQQKLFSDKGLGVPAKPVQLGLFTAGDIEQQQKFIKIFFSNLKDAVEQYAKGKSNTFLASKTRDAIVFLELLITKYDIACANPPYTDSSDFGPELKEFIGANYQKPYKFHSNLYVSFIKRCYEMIGNDGKIALIHPHTFMFIKTFEGVREFIIKKAHIDIMVDFGLDRVNLFGSTILVEATFYVLSKTKNKDDGLYFNLSNNLQEKFKKYTFLEALDDHVALRGNNRIYSLNQSKLKTIKSWPFIYWISDEFREKFKHGIMGETHKVCAGLSTANNMMFLRFWWEISENSIGKEWILYAKGGPYNKWYGNIWLAVNWKNNGEAIRNYGAIGTAIRNESYYFQRGITNSLVSVKGISARIIPEDHIFDIGAPSVFIDKSKSSIEYCLGFVNSKLIQYIANCFNPTANLTWGDFAKFPFIIPSRDDDSFIKKIVKVNIQVKKFLEKTALIEKSFDKKIFGFENNKGFVSNTSKLNNMENFLLSQVLINEAIINEKIFEVYDLTENDKAMVLAKEGKSIGGLPVSAKARTAFVHEKNKEEDFVSFLPFVDEYIANLATKEFTHEEQQTITSEFTTLYQSNNNLEEFCIRHQINPINVWYWFKESKVIPKQRMNTLAMEFLADMIREILMEDEDGIIPLVPNAGEKILLNRIEDKFTEKGFSSAQFASFDTVLGRPLPEYLNKYFFAALSDHLNLFMYLPKTPFIWHLSSGPEHGFECYIIIYKWSRDNLLRIRSVYIEHRERSLINRQTDLANNESAEAQNEKDIIFKQLKEIESFKTKIDELLAEGYDPILDDGVGKNIAPLQKKKMIPYDVLNKAQLKKYLNADW
jgi:hypothetical protein